MTMLLRRLAGMLLWGSLAYCAGCARGDELTAVLSQPVDTTLQQRVANQLQARSLKIKGPVTIQLGGSDNVATTTDAAKAKAPVAAAPQAAATQANAATRPPWLVYAVVVFVLLVAGGWLGFRLARS